ncbi:MAG: bifunctional (p)ppGpp synthetase/guanosine-3',5'-bis(diphosphate) 3'-pyrophosphohydrolase [Candidatus Pacebacteria bacterium]|nr:bifunctional (p)ppGpp synthetase/guanosine-3',5'-bis(diphosphate) 3'-pyrophosphohydrolase [Candidatus Paceibacterota bacterium]
MELAERAEAIAKKAHEGQVRKTDGTPYIEHPLAVAKIVAEYGFTEAVVAAAIVHDVLEDTDVSEEELRSKLGDEVVDIVTAVSEDKRLEWRDRKSQYIAQVVNADEQVKAVSVADKIHNAESLLAYYATHGAATWEKFNRGRSDKLWFERTLCDKLKKVWQHPLLDRYEMLVTRLEQTTC